MLQDIDAYWLQREVAKAFGDAVKKDERLSQKLAEEVRRPVHCVYDARAPLR